MTQTSPYYRGAWEPVDKETTAYDLPVRGTIPPQLDGLFVRIGPNRLPDAGPSRQILGFLDDGMLHGVRVADGNAEWYRSRWVRSKTVTKSLGGVRPPGPPRRVWNDAVNTHVVAHGGSLLALVEGGCVPARLSTTLDTVEYTNFGGTLPHGFTAHPKRDPVTGELFAIAYNPILPYAEYLIVDTNCRVRKVERIDVPKRPMMHDFALTENHIVVLDLPVVFKPTRIILGRVPYCWEPKHTSRFGVLPREGRGQEIRWFEVAAGFVFHIVNAYETGRKVTVEAMRYDRMFDAAPPNPIARGAVYWRWVLDLDTGTVTESQLDDRYEELPSLDDRQVGRRHRYVYSALFRPRDRYDADGFSVPVMLVQRDLDTDAVLTHDFGAGMVPSQPVFVPDGPQEGQGWVLSYVYDTARDGSDLVILDARDFAGPPVAVVSLPHRVPSGFHGSWVAAADLDAIDDLTGTRRDT
ncbi:carotenoid oxygenase family protein [Nocardia sp. NPDC052112]|uniref:carotenoid oxygenase family protein n=1 Tax=Nocardia sp. NPDC052112 TaxID=3155646 RepID=UPI0034389278